MLLKTFAYAHIPVLEAVPQDLRGTVSVIYGQSVPTGALVMAALAVSLLIDMYSCIDTFILLG